MRKPLRRALKLALVAALAWYFPVAMAILFACGVYDVSRNRPLTRDMLGRYFLGNGVLTWLLSPFNVVLDILALPFINRRVYRIDELPPAWQAEVRELVATAYRENVVGRLAARAGEESRSMFFWKWYGSNVETTIDVPAWHRRFKYVQTIGVSVFNKRQSTGKHFGPLRPTLRFLYNLNEMQGRSAWIAVGDTVQYWQDRKDFIFDDTLQHQSFNESDELRFCLFVDIVRPSAVPALLVAVVSSVRVLLKGVNFIFYRHWKVIAR